MGLRDGTPAIGVNTSYFTVFNVICDPAMACGGSRQDHHHIQRFVIDQPGGFSLAEYRYLQEHARAPGWTGSVRLAQIGAGGHHAM
jgi:hypothetical protein